MRIEDILAQRLVTQRLAGAPHDSPSHIVRWLTAVQSQDYPGAKWSLSMRCGWTFAEIDKAFDDGRFLRTHVLRPTWHFVMPQDIRWLLSLTAPHVKQRMATANKRLELDGRTFANAQTLIAGALAGNNSMTRDEIVSVLRTNGISGDSLRYGHLIMDAELDGLICSGPLKGKHHSWMLLDERAPAGTDLRGDEALAELAYRFFASHGPASDRDFARWSGLTLGKSRRGLEMAGSRLEGIEFEGQRLWFAPPLVEERPEPDRCWLLPEYDECFLTYPNLNFPVPGANSGTWAWNERFYRPVILGLNRIGNWHRTIQRSRVLITINLFGPAGDAEFDAIEAAAERYGTFIGMPVDVQYGEGETAA